MLLSRKHKVHKLEMGFTLIEVMMFLAISSLMLVGILSSYSGTRQRSQFRDAVQQTVDNLRQLKTEANTTVNIEGSGDDENFVASGQLAYIATGTNNNKLNVHLIKEPDDDTPLNFTPPLTQVRVETVPWGAYFSAVTYKNSEIDCTPSKDCYLGFYRDSTSGQLHTVFTSDDIPRHTNGVACLELQSPQGFFARIDINLGNNSIGVLFDARCK